MSQDGGAKPPDEAAVQDSEPVTWYDIVEPQKVPRSLRRLPGLCREAVRLVWAAGRRELVAAMAIKAVNGAGLAVVLLLGRDVIAAVAAAGRSGAGAGPVLPRLLLLTAVTAGLGFLAAIGREISEILAELASRHAQAEIIEACAVELEAYDTPAFHNRLLRASMGGQFRPWQIVEGLVGLAGALVAILGITGALLALQPWLVPLVIVAAVPLLVAAARSGEMLFRFHHRMTEVERRRNYLYMLLSGKDAAKELRAFGLAGFLRERFDRLYDEHLVELRKVARRRLRVSLVGNLAASTVLAGTVAGLLALALGGHIGLAEAGTAAAAVFLLGERLTSAVGSAGQLYESSLFIEDFTSFVALRPEVEARRRRHPAPSGFRRLSVEDVSFTYPSATDPALEGVSLEIGAGEIVALVGENGSGKTTLAKLLCRLYLPHAGRILWDGVDTATVDPDGLRRSVAVIFQASSTTRCRHGRTSAWAATSDSTTWTRWWRQPPRPAPTTPWPSCRRATTRSSAPSSTAARSCRSASGNGWPWPGRSSATPRSSSWTSRPPRWTPGPSTTCSRGSGPSARAGRCC